MAPVSSKTPTEIAREIFDAAALAAIAGEEDAISAIERIISARDAEFEDRCIAKVEAAVERVTREVPALDYRESAVTVAAYATRTGERIEGTNDGRQR